MPQIQYIRAKENNKMPLTNAANLFMNSMNQQQQVGMQKEQLGLQKQEIEAKIKRNEALTKQGEVEGFNNYIVATSRLAKENPELYNKLTPMMSEQLEKLGIPATPEYLKIFSDPNVEISTKEDFGKMIKPGGEPIGQTEYIEYITNKGYDANKTKFLMDEYGKVVKLYQDMQKAKQQTESYELGKQGRENKAEQQRLIAIPESERTPEQTARLQNLNANLNVPSTTVNVEGSVTDRERIEITANSKLRTELESERKDATGKFGITTVDSDRINAKSNIITIKENGGTRAEALEEANNFLSKYKDSKKAEEYKNSLIAYIKRLFPTKK